MSEKKAPEKKEKEKLVHVTEEQLKAGKEEIMKIVNGQPGAEKLGEMLDKGRKKGRLSSNELMDVLEDMDLESEQMDKIYDVLWRTWASTPWGRTICPSCLTTWHAPH